MSGRKKNGMLREYVLVCGIPLFLTVFLHKFVISAYEVSSGSMEATLFEGDYIFVSKLAYMSEEPTRGDIIVFKYPKDMSKVYIKRLIAIPGDTIEIVNKHVFINGRENVPPSHVTFTNASTSDTCARDEMLPFVVPQGEYFVMGDNRDDSRDSRFWGTVPQDNIIGEAVFIYFSVTPEDKLVQNAGFLFDWLVFLPERIRTTRIFTYIDP